MKILMLLPYAPNKIRIRTLRNIEDISKIFEIDLIYLDDGLSADIPDAVKVLKVVNNQSMVKRIFRLVVGLVLKKPMTYQYYNNLGLAKLIESIDLNGYQKIYIERLPFIEYKIPFERVIFDVVDCFSDQVRQISRNLTSARSYLYLIDAILINKYERDLCNAASHVLVTTNLEAEKLKKIGVNSKISAFLHGLQVEVNSECDFSLQRFKKLSFHGKLTYKPNLDALAYLNNKIIVEIPRDVKVQIIGDFSKIEYSKYNQLNFEGYVDDLKIALSGVDASIFPINIAVGIQNKVLESLALGVPVIVTPLIYKSLPDACGILNEGIFVGELSEFPDIVKKCYSYSDSQWLEFRLNCVKYMNLIVDADLHRQEILKIFED